MRIIKVPGRKSCIWQQKLLRPLCERQRCHSEDVKEANVIIGNVDPALVKEREKSGTVPVKLCRGRPVHQTGDPSGTGGARKCDGCLRACVSEHMLALTFDLIRRFNQYHANQAKHIWQSMGNITSVEGSTILVLGLGDIGGDYARKVPCTRRSCDRCPPHEPE